MGGAVRARTRVAAVRHSASGLGGGCQPWVGRVLTAHPQNPTRAPSAIPRGLQFSGDADYLRPNTTVPTSTGAAFHHSRRTSPLPQPRSPSRNLHSIRSQAVKPPHGSRTAASPRPAPGTELRPRSRGFAHRPRSASHRDPDADAQHGNAGRTGSLPSLDALPRAE